MTITGILLNKLTKIIILEILEIVPALGIINTRFLNPVFLNVVIVYIKFGLLRIYLYIYANNTSLNNICIYSNIFGMTVAKSINIKIAKKSSLR